MRTKLKISNSQSKSKITTLGTTTAPLPAGYVRPFEPDGFIYDTAGVQLSVIEDQEEEDVVDDELSIRLMSACFTR
jgi:hypothetical protein